MNNTAKAIVIIGLAVVGTAVTLMLHRKNKKRGLNRGFDYLMEDNSDNELNMFKGVVNE